MAGTIIGAIGGMIIVWIIILVKSEGPTLSPGNYTPGSGPGCFVSLFAYILGAAIGAVIGTVIASAL